MADDMDAFTVARDKSRWSWTLLLMVPDWLGHDEVTPAVEPVAASRRPVGLDGLRLEALSEGRCVQTLHVGSFAQQLGAESSIGAAMVLAIVRESAPVATALLIAGAGGSAMTADLGSRRIRNELDAVRIAEIEAEEFFDFQAVRPMMRVRDDGERRIEWPENEFWKATAPSPHDLVLLNGVEPSLRWKLFCRTVLDLAVRLDVEMIVTLGALQVDVPHTRPVPMTVTTSDLAVADRLGIQVGTYEGPTGITGVLHTMATEAGIPSVSVWTGVPHYLASTSYLPGALALAEQVGTLAEVELPLGRLARDAVQQSDEIAELVDSDEDLSDYVDELEHRATGDVPFGLDPGDTDGQGAGETRELPMNDPAGADLPRDLDGEDIAAELEQFLRDNGER